MSEAIALVGSGLIGRGWAILFAEAGLDVRIHDEDPDAEARARPAISDALPLLERRGVISSVSTLISRIRFCKTLGEAVDGASYVQESVYESLAVKQQVFREISAVAGSDAIIASSCSGIPPEQFMAEATGRERCLIAHPFSPPHLIPLVEIVPTRWTRADVIEKTCDWMKRLGRQPVMIHKALPGFAVNRLQAAVIDAAVSLVTEGVIEPGDLDLCMSQGLGLRWSFIGPFETMDLNAPRGFGDYVSRYQGFLQSLLPGGSAGRSWDPEALDRIEKWLRSQRASDEDIVSRRLWRDDNLAKLSQLFRGHTPRSLR